jgi:hypothetical protein
VISDIGKCAVSQTVARETEPLRYETCFHWLEEELFVLGSKVIIAIGSLAERALANRRSRLGDVRLLSVPHYSGANRGRLYAQLDADWQRELPDDEILSAWYRECRGRSRQYLPEPAPHDADRKFLAAYRASFTRIRKELELKPLA